MKKIVTYKYRKNGAYTTVSYKKESSLRAKEDVLWLEWHTEEKEKVGIGMRMDEALLISEMLVEAVRVCTESYETSKPIKSYRIKKK